MNCIQQRKKKRKARRVSHASKHSSHFLVSKDESFHFYYIQDTFTNDLALEMIFAQALNLCRSRYKSSLTCTFDRDLKTISVNCHWYLQSYVFILILSVSSDFLKDQDLSFEIKIESNELVAQQVTQASFQQFPIVRNNLFIFFSLEGYQSHQLWKYSSGCGEQPRNTTAYKIKRTCHLYLNISDFKNVHFVKKVIMTYYNAKYLFLVLLKNFKII